MKRLWGICGVFIACLFLHLIPTNTQAHSLQKLAVYSSDTVMSTGTDDTSEIPGDDDDDDDEDVYPVANAIQVTPDAS